MDSSNSSGPIWDIAKRSFAVKLLICSLYALIFLLGLVGNALVIFVVLRKKSMQTITNIFIANLAVSDVLMGLVATPFTPYALYMENWTLPSALCKILPMTMGVSVYVSTLTSTAIAVDRYFVIVHPFIPRMKTWLCILIIFAVWVIAILISMPLAVYQQKQYDVKKNLSSCHENWPKESSREVFTIVSFALQFVVPCSITSVCYLKVSMVLQMRCRTKIGSGLKSRQKEEMEIRRKRRTNKMLIAMVTIFVVCWIPLNVLWMVIDILSSELTNRFKKSNYFTLVFFICHLGAMSSAVYNPFLYAWMNENFKKEFHKVIPCVFPKPSTKPNSENISAPPDSRIEQRMKKQSEILVNEEFNDETQNTQSLEECISVQQNEYLQVKHYGGDRKGIGDARNGLDEIIPLNKNHLEFDFEEESTTTEDGNITVATIQHSTIYHDETEL